MLHTCKECVVDLVQFVGGIIDKTTRSSYYAIPALVVANGSVGGGGYVHVQPSIKLDRDETQQVKSHSVLKFVPLVFPSSSSGGMTFPVGVGDEVLLVFSQRSLDEWKASGVGDIVEKSSDRLLDSQDAFAIPCIFPVSKRPANSNPEDTYLWNGGNEVRIRPSGMIDVIALDSVTVNATNKVEVNCVDAVVNASGTTTINSPTITLNGDVTITGSAEVVGATTLSSTLDVIGGASLGGGATVEGVDIGSHNHQNTTPPMI